MGSWYPGTVSGLLVSGQVSGSRYHNSQVRLVVLGNQAMFGRGRQWTYYQGKACRHLGKGKR